MFGKLLSVFGSSKTKGTDHDPEYDRTMDDVVTTWTTAFYELCTGEQIDNDLHFEDATETLYEGFQMFEDLTLDRIAKYSEADVKNLVAAAKSFLEHDRLTKKHIRYLLEETLWHYEKRPNRPVLTDYVKS